MGNRSLIAIVAAGTIARLGALAVTWHKPLSPDAEFYLFLAHRFSFLEPWASSTREPLWVALVKVASAPFGYPAAALRALDTGFSILVVVAVAVGLLAIGDRAVALAGTAYVALSPRLITTAPRGLRENAATLAFLPVVYYAISGDRRWRWPAAVCVGLVAVVRFELAPIAFVLVLARSLVDRSPRVLAAAAAATFILAGPWLVANGHRYGDPLYASNVQATWFRNYELVESGSHLPYAEVGYGGPQTTWGEFYLETLGLKESARRTVRGAVVLPALVTRGALYPIVGPDAVDTPPRPIRIVLIAAGAGLMLLGVVGTIVKRSWKGALAFAVVALGLLPYLPLTIDLRLVTHLYVVLALPIGIGVVAAVGVLWPVNDRHRRLENAVDYQDR